MMEATFHSHIIKQALQEDSLYQYLVALISENRDKYSAIHSGLLKEFITLYDYGIEVRIDLNSGFDNIKFIVDTVDFNTEYVPYAYKMPFSLEKEYTRDQVRASLGAPTTTRDCFKNSMITLPYLEQYDKGSFYINIQYTGSFQLCDLSIMKKK